MSENIVDRVLQLLADTKDSNYKIAKATKISESAIGRYTRGLSRPTEANAILLQQYFNGMFTEIKTLQNIEFVQVPFVPIFAQGGYPSGYGDIEYIESLPTIPVIVDKKFKGNYRIFEVNGDSMDDGTRNAICDKDKLLCREVVKPLWQHKLHIKDWYFVIIHKSDGITLKQITDHNVENADILCHPLNENFTDFTLNLNDVVEIYNVIKIVDRNTRL